MPVRSKLAGVPNGGLPVDGRRGDVVLRVDDEKEGADLLSDEYGVHVKGCSFKVIDNPHPQAS